MFDHRTQTRMFEYAHDEKKQWVGVPYWADLKTEDGKEKNCTDFEDGEKGEGTIEIAGVKYEKWLTCVEP